MSKTQLIQGDCLEHIPKLEDSSIHAVCTDPPYGLVEFSPEEIVKLRNGQGGIWRLPPKWDGCTRRPLPRFSVLNEDQKKGIESFFSVWAAILKPKIRPGGHVLIAGNPVLQMYVQRAMVAQGFENRATIIRLYHGFRGGDRPKNAEKEFSDVCVSPRGNYEPWMLFRKPISERTVAANLRKWETGALRMLDGGSPLPDVIPSFKTPIRERRVADHPSLKPQHLLRIFVRALLPMGRGVVLDPFMGSGSTMAAALSIGVDAIGIENDSTFFMLAERVIPELASQYPGMMGNVLDYPETNADPREYTEQQMLLFENRPKYGL
ncbi:MAG: DNA methyltransferase [Kiritimatiellae bacterium]|nr:DNA methyltransferase [Kiritimatiellia bacterium]MDD4735860.1 DNA methyltransferase [Kiritimatiellia bacterium]